VNVDPESRPSTATVTRAFKIFLTHATRRRYHRADGASWEVPVDRESFRKRLGETIREARRRLGMRQEDLAREAGFEHLQTVSDIERGQREVHAYELVRISAALGLQVADLLDGRLPPMPAVLWRNPPAREDRRRTEEARFLRFCREYRWLEEQLGALPGQALPHYPLSQVASFREAAGLGEKVAADLKLGNRPATSLARVLEEDFGVKLWYADLREGSGACTASPEFGHAVMLNRTEPPWRRNFSLAHELFHLLTLAGPVDAAPCGPARDLKSAEPFANAFAAALLLPGDQVRREIHGRVREGRLHRADLVGLARSYGVSTEALLWRMVSLRFLPEDRVRELLDDPSFRQLDRQQRQQDWEEAPVRSERFERLAVQAWLEGKISKARLAELLHLPLRDVDGAIRRLGFPEQGSDEESEPYVEVPAH
jgi:Zn-dependent peptidase ImmA (M78 family)/transcriptional regulator with XRE-family HTH domain